MDGCSLRDLSPLLSGVGLSILEVAKCDLGSRFLCGIAAKYGSVESLECDDSTRGGLIDLQDFCFVLMN